MAQKPYLTKVPNLIYVHGFVVDAPMPMLDCNDFFFRDFSKFFMLEHVFIRTNLGPDAKSLG